MKKAKASTATIGRSKSSSASTTLTAPASIRYVAEEPTEPGVPCTIHAPIDCGVVMSDRAYVLIHVHPGQTSQVVRALNDIKQIKTIDPCWGKPDIIVVVEVPDQDALTQLVLSRIHSIEGVSQTDTHLVYQLKDGKPK